MPVLKTLVISATPPGTAGTGEPVLREICLAFPVKALAFLVLDSLNYSLPGDTNDITDLEIRRLKLPQELLKAASKLPLLKETSLYSQRQKYWREVEELKKQAIEYGAAHNCKQVLAILGSPTVTLIAQAVAKALGADLISLTWDPHETTMQLLHFDDRTQARVMAHFESCLKASKSLAVASDGMRREYKSRYGVDGIPLFRPVRKEQVRLQRSKSLKESDLQIVIGFSGSLYAKKEFAALFEALSSVDWNVAGKPVVFKVLSNYFFFPQDFAQQHSSIQLLGFRDRQSVVEELSKCHAVYLPYWFDESRALSVRTCFPDKLGTYLTSGVPIFFHGPAVSTPADFFLQYPVGKTCHSLETKDILETLHALVTDESFRHEAWKARNKALQTEYSLDSFRAKIARLLDVSTGELNANI